MLNVGERYPLRVAICIGTFRRPLLLRDLLQALGNLEFARVECPAIKIIVVDNDVSRSAKAVCDGISLPWTLRYVCEWRRGIARVRNRALREAGDFDFLAFIDDDEIPEPTWLDELLAAQARSSADVISGPVLPAFADGAPEWVRTGEFFERPNFVTGESIERCSTNNVLIRKNVFASAPQFDERFNLTGGEDTHFFLRVGRAGHSMLWCREAVVRESIPLERANLAWILRRGYQSGNSWILCELALDSRRRIWIIRFLKAWVHTAVGTAALMLSPLSGHASAVRSLRRICLGAGMLAALLGHRFLSYRNSAINRVENAVDTGTWT
jgi:succinoglycan biosynthesis protein ExoM